VCEPLRAWRRQATPTEECYERLHSEPHVCPIDQTVNFAALAPLSVRLYLPTHSTSTSWELEALKGELLGHVEPQHRPALYAEFAALDWVHDNMGLWFSLRWVGGWVMPWGGRWEVAFVLASLTLFSSIPLAV
jgi:hypothetical protein